jgi:polyketide synthase-associated protein
MDVAGYGEDIVDLSFPGEPSTQFGYEIISCIAQKGYCTIAMPDIDEDERRNALAAAQQLPRHYRMKREIEVGYMGLDSNTKVSMRKHDSPKIPLKDTMTRCDRCLTYIALSLNGIPADDLGFVSKSRTNAFVRTSYKDSFEESILTPESLAEIEDTQDWIGDVRSFLNFTQARTLSMLYMLENSGGDVWLYPKDSKQEYSVHVPVIPNKLLIWRHDLAEYSYQPYGGSIALQAWVMRDKSQLKNINAVNLDIERRLAVVNPGQPEPTGPPVHVTALHVRMPGEVEGKDQWWTLFVGGTEGCTQWPSTRWPTEPYFMEGDEASQRGLSYTKHGGFTSSEQCMDFDNEFFGIPDSEAKTMIVGQRWVAEVGYTCLSMAGYTRRTLEGQPIGTWVGDVGPDWHSFNTAWAHYHPDAPGELMATNTHCHVTAARLAYTFDMRGPVSSYDTACSASLVAMNAAHTFMFAEDPPGPEHSRALVMGVNTLLGPWSYIGNCAAGMLSHQGRSFTFNRSADGYQRGEGCGSIFLNTQISDEEKKNAHASIIGTATNQDGRSASITAPNGPSQTAVIQRSMRFAGIDVNLVTMAECHGTGTALGDPIEVGALQAVMKKRTIPMIKVSTKSHIGHLEAGAGIAGLTKCVQMIRASCGPPNCHFNFINAHLVVDGYPVLFDTEVVDTGYSSGYCGVSSFGFGGTNSRCDVFSEAALGSRKKIHIPLPPPSFARHIFDMGDEVNFIGTTGAWSNAEAFISTQEHGVLTYHMTLGQTRVENFRLMLGSDESRLIYPSTHKASASEQVLGTDSE